MTGFQKVGVLLIVLGVLYALLYVMWLRRSRKDPPAPGRLSGTAAAPVAGPIAGSERPGAAGQPRPLARVEGTYVGTTMASSRHERVAAAKFAVRARGTMAVNDSNVRWERGGGTGGVTVAGTRLRGVSLERDRAGGARAHIIRVSWQADNGDHKATAFLPRKKAHSDTLVSAVQRLMTMCASSGEVGHVVSSVQDTRPQDTPAKTQAGMRGQAEAGTIQDGTP